MYARQEMGVSVQVLGTKDGQKTRGANLLGCTWLRE